LDHRAIRLSEPVAARGCRRADIHGLTIDVITNPGFVGFKGTAVSDIEVRGEIARNEPAEGVAITLKDTTNLLSGRKTRSSAMRPGKPVRLVQGPLGLSWQITPRVLTDALAAGGAEAARALEAMMPMRKIDVATIEAAGRGALKPISRA
jgi:hypothetical protein